MAQWGILLLPPFTVNIYYLMGPLHFKPLTVAGYIAKNIFGIALVALYLSVAASASSPTAPIVGSHSDSADNGAAQIVDNTNSGYQLIQSSTVNHGANAFQLAHYNFDDLDDNFVLFPRFSITSDTKLYFQSRLRYATIAQRGKVEVSTDNGENWSEVYNITGANADTEVAFSLKTIDLSTYAGQNICIRFTYTHTSGSIYALEGQTASVIGWFIDNIQIGSSFQKDFYDFGTPGNDEQLYIEKINRARASAEAEATRLANPTNSDVLNAYTFWNIDTNDISTQYEWAIENNHMDAIAQPLAPNKILQQAAELHSLDMKTNLFQGHDSSSDPPPPFSSGDTLGVRVTKLGYDYFGLSENVYAYAKSVQHGHVGFATDWGDTSNTESPAYNPEFVGQNMQNPPGHRLTIHNDSFKEIGVGIHTGAINEFGPQFVTQDLGNPANAAAFVTGVVYDDSNTNSEYDSGEGLSGFQVDVDTSSNYTRSSSSGGYALPVSIDGSAVITFSIGGSVAHTETVTISGLKNIKVDYRPTGYALWVKNIHPTITGGMTGDDDEDGRINLVEYAFHANAEDPSDAEMAIGVVTTNSSMDHTLTSVLPSVREDITYTAQWSTDFSTWYDITPTFANGQISATITRSDAADQLSVSESSITTMFMRWEISL